MTKRYPRTLSSGANNTVIALSEMEVGKLYHEEVGERLFDRFVKIELEELAVFSEYFLSR